MNTTKLSVHLAVLNSKAISGHFDVIHPAIT